MVSSHNPCDYCSYGCTVTTNITLTSTTVDTSDPTCPYTHKACSECLIYTDVESYKSSIDEYSEQEDNRKESQFNWGDIYKMHNKSYKKYAYNRIQPYIRNNLKMKIRKDPI